MITKIKMRIILISLMILLFLPVLTLATDPLIKTLLNESAGEEGAGYATDPNLAKTGLARVVGQVARVVISLLGVIFISYTIYGGYMWMTAAGNEEKISKARKTIRDGIIGLILIIAAAGIYLFIREAIVVIPGGGNTPSEIN